MPCMHTKLNMPPVHGERNQGWVGHERPLPHNLAFKAKRWGGNEVPRILES